MIQRETYSKATNRSLAAILAALVIQTVASMTDVSPLHSAASVSPPQTKQPTATFIVNSTADTDDGVCDSADCTLREAINAANLNPGVDTIEFNVGAGTPTINVGGSGLPSITQAVIIDGNTGGATRVELNGSGAGAFGTGFRITSGGCTIRNFIINRFAMNGIELSIGGANVVEGCFVGTNAAGSAAAPNGENGILVNTSNNNRIGGTSAAARNVLSGNNLHGVLIYGAASGNQIQGNHIGTDATGSFAIGNVGEGVSITSAPNNTIGGSAAGARNVISGNGGKGVRIIDTPAFGNVVLGNYIGLNASGTGAVGNVSDGIDIFDAAGNTIGGTTSEARNVISGNGVFGIRINIGSGNSILGNYIGTRPNGMTAQPNGYHGVFIGNNASTNTIGGPAVGEGNIIASNGSAGVAIESGSGNSIRSNSMFSNGALAIDLGTSGVTPNDVGDGDTGANGLQNFPVLTSANTVAGGGALIEGTLNSTPSTTFTIEFFASPACDASGNGEGKTPLGSASVTTDGGGNASFAASYGSTLAHGTIITATATNPQGSTSEFSACFQLVGLADLAVSKAGSPAPVPAGSNITYTITLTNNGPNDASSVTLTDDLPLSVSFVSCSATGGGVCGGSGNNRTVTFSTLVSGASATVTIVARVSCSVADAATITNTASATSSVPDSNIANNSSTISTTASNPQPSISPTSASFPTVGGNGSVSVTSQTGCTWTAVSNDSWITITSGSAGSGNGTVNYSVAANTSGSSRTGTMTIAGHTFTVNQEYVVCTYSILPTSASYSADGGTGSTNVTAPSGCPWKAETDDAWITITGGDSGTGNGTVSYSIGVNAGPSSRTGTITIASLPFTVNQAAPCTYSIAPTSVVFPSTGGEEAINITAPSDCSWTAVASDSWIEITSAASGTGNGIVTYAVRDNLSERIRVGTITIAGRTHSIYQQSVSGENCTWAITPVSASFSVNGGTGSINIIGLEECIWSATTSQSWITITSDANGVASGVVTYSVSRNTSGVVRRGFITISGKVFTVKQKGI